MAYDLEEQEQIANFKAFWNRFGNLILWVLIIALGGYAAYTTVTTLGLPAPLGFLGATLAGALAGLVLYGGLVRQLLRQSGETFETTEKCRTLYHFRLLQLHHHRTCLQMTSKVPVFRETALAPDTDRGHGEGPRFQVESESANENMSLSAIS